MKVNYENAPHIALVTTDIRICELKNNGELVPVTKNRPFIVKKRFNSLEEAKVFEAEGISTMLEMIKEESENCEFGTNENNMPEKSGE